MESNYVRILHHAGLSRRPELPLELKQIHKIPTWVPHPENRYPQALLGGYLHPMFAAGIKAVQSILLPPEPCKPLKAL